LADTQSMLAKSAETVAGLDMQLKQATEREMACKVEMEMYRRDLAAANARTAELEADLARSTAVAADMHRLELIVADAMKVATARAARSAPRRKPGPRRQRVEASE